MDASRGDPIAGERRRRRVGRGRGRGVDGARESERERATGGVDVGVDGDGASECASDKTDVLISDYVYVPDDLPAGEYVLGWRWDGEETAQVWQNCADVSIRAAA